MIDLKDIRENPELYQRACENKRVAFNVKEFLELDTEYRELLSSIESLRANQNKANKELRGLTGADKQNKLEEMKGYSTKLKDESPRLKDLEVKWKSLQYRIPSIPLEEVPLGKDDTENVEVGTYGDIPNFSFTPKDHSELGLSLDIMDIERGVKIAGTRSFFLKGDGARLQHAVMSLAMDLLHRKGYTLFDPPHIVRHEAMLGTGYFPGGEEQAYHLDERDEGFYLIGTSEVPVASYHMDEILDRGSLPLRYAGYSPCYRREAGSYGKDTQGLYRVHQFFKVEQVVICEASAEVSRELHNELLANSEEMMKLLELPYRVVKVCTGDIGLGQLFKHDIEAWMPSRQKYGETHSCSSFHDFQARRLGLRYKDENGKSVYCYTLNNTCIASPRVLIPLLEIHQQEDGSVKLPHALRKYMDGQEVITRR